MGMTRKAKAHRHRAGRQLTRRWDTTDILPTAEDDDERCLESSPSVELICMLLAEGYEYEGTNERGAPMFKAQNGTILTLSGTAEDAAFAEQGGLSKTLRL